MNNRPANSGKRGSGHRALNTAPQEFKLHPSERLRILKRFLGPSSVTEVVLCLRPENVPDCPRLVGDHSIRIHIPISWNSSELVFESTKYDAELRIPEVAFNRTHVVFNASGEVIVGSVHGFPHKNTRDDMLFAEDGALQDALSEPENKWTRQARSHFDELMRQIDLQGVRPTQNLWPPFMDVEEWLARVHRRSTRLPFSEPT